MAPERFCSAALAVHFAAQDFHLCPRSDRSAGLLRLRRKRGLGHHGGKDKG